jgi:hypothetical protein
VDLIPPRRPDFWLTPDDRKATDFRAVAENEGTAASGGTQLNLRFHWDRRLAEAYWDSPNDSPELRLEARGVVLGDIGPLTPRVWTVLGERLAVALERILAEVSFVYVHCAGEEPALLLVQEEGMSHKPSLLLNLSAADILRYWSLLTPEQRAAFIESRAPESALLDQGADLVARAKLALEHTTLFDRFAGFFHAFSCLERSVRAALDADPRREREAMYRLFGKKYDSLGNLLDRVLSRDDVGDDVDKYVLVLCARQLCQVIRSDYSEFWNAHRADGRALVDRFATADSIRSRLIERDPSKLESFLDWFDRWFLSRAQRVEAEA